MIYNLHRENEVENYFVASLEKWKTSTFMKALFQKARSAAMLIIL